MNDSRADGARAAYPLFQTGDGGSRPTSALQLFLAPIDFKDARRLNKRWHSRLPLLGAGSRSNLSRMFICYGAEFDGFWYAVAIWSLPAARGLPSDRTCLELRRLAVAPDAPRNTASRMLRVMALLLRRSRPELTRLVSYQDTEVHTGGIYKAAGWERIELRPRKAAEWSCKSRPRPKSQSAAQKVRWEKSLA